MENGKLRIESYPYKAHRPHKTYMPYIKKFAGIEKDTREQIDDFPAGGEVLFYSALSPSPSVSVVPKS